MRVVEAFIDRLDLGTVGFVRPPILPKRLLYGYLNRVPFSRRLEAEA